MILICGGIKGGSGKSTLATNFAIMRALDGRDVLLVDADDQESATDFTVLRNEATGEQCGYTGIQLRDRAVLTELRKLQQKYEDIVIDTGGRDTQSHAAQYRIGRERDQGKNRARQCAHEGLICLTAGNDNRSLKESSLTQSGLAGPVRLFAEFRTTPPVALPLRSLTDHREIGRTNVLQPHRQAVFR